MMLEEAEAIKREYTDQYVTLVSDPPARLARFAGYVGLVKTVNMSGRAMVEWLDYHENIGWYDIEVGHLQVVEKPPEPAAKKPVAKPAAKKAPAKKKSGEPSPLELLRQQGGGKPSAAKPADKPPAKKPSPIELLRQQGGTKKKPADDSPAEPAKGEDQAKQSDTSEPAKSSTSDILAKLREQGGKKD